MNNDLEKELKELQIQYDKVLKERNELEKENKLLKKDLEILEILKNSLELEEEDDDISFKFKFCCYKESLKKQPDEEFKNIMRFILQKNILQGDSLNGIDKIIFTQWTLVGYQFKREEFSFSQLNQQAEIMNTPLFASLTNDKGEDVFIPQPIKEYPLTYYRNLGGLA